MLFFQVALLAGYAYAHFVSPWLEKIGKAWLHPVFMLTAFTALPIAISKAATPPTIEDPTMWQLGLMAATVGLPFFWVSTNGPILQRWFSMLGHKDSSDPYFLYAASNVGSLGGLLAYPFLIEPNLALHDQSRFWMVGYGVLVVGVAVCALKIPRSREQTVVEEFPEPLSTTRVLSWIGLSFVPSSFLLGVTTFISTDLAAVPLLWVVPLSLYLLSFVIVFARRPLIPHSLVTAAFPFVLIALIAIVALNVKKPLWPVVAVHLIVFFWTSLQAHGRLAADRPHTSRLTGYFLAIAFGGVLGGVFNSLVAPTLFADVYEYPGIMAAAALLVGTTRREKWWSVGIGLGLGVLLYAAIRTQQVYGLTSDAPAVRLMFIAAALAVLLCLRNRWRFFLACCGMLFVGRVFINESGRLVYRDRSFFGVAKVVLTPTTMRLFHGTTLHGVQVVPPSRNPEPRSYYTRSGPIGDVFLVRGVPANAHIGVVGMGAGSLAAYLKPGQTMDFFEIDPGIVLIANNPVFFTYIPTAKGEVNYVLGDARLSLQRNPKTFDVLVLDAYSSDAVPVHLMTLEAVRLYEQRLNPGGVLAFHISNRHLNLKPVLAGIAQELGMTTILRSHDLSDTSLLGANSSEWVLMARDLRDFGKLFGHSDWGPLAPTAGFRTWTDDYSSILTVLRY